MQTKSETVTADNGAKVEVATVTFQGRDFTALGSCVDEASGRISAYVSGIPGAYVLRLLGTGGLASERPRGRCPRREVENSQEYRREFSRLPLGGGAGWCAAPLARGYHAPSHATKSC